MVDEDIVPVGSFTKQTQVTLGAPENGGVVQRSAPAHVGVGPRHRPLRRRAQPRRLLLGHGHAQGHDLRPGRGARLDERRRDAAARRHLVVARAGRGRRRQGPDLEQAGHLHAQLRPAHPKAPNDGASVVYSPLLQWSPVSGACGYEVQVTRDPSFGGENQGGEPLKTAQTALVPPKAHITTPGVHYWRVRADYCGDVTGQWTATRSFRSVFPPDFNLNSVPAQGGLRPPGRHRRASSRTTAPAVKKARLYLERRIYPSDAFTAGRDRQHQQLGPLPLRS